MLKRKHTVILCVDNEYHLKMQRFVDENIKTIGVVRNYVDDHKSFTAFETKMDIKSIDKLLLYLEKDEITYFGTTVIGDLIIVD